MFSFTTVDVSTGCSSHSQGRSKMRCEDDSNLIGAAPGHITTERT